MEELIDNSVFPEPLVESTLEYGSLLEFTDSPGDEVGLTERGLGAAYQEGVSGGTEPYFLEGLLDAEVYMELLSKLESEEFSSNDKLRESDILRVIQSEYDPEGYEERELRSGIRTLFLTIEAAGLGDYNMSRATTEAAVTLRSDISLESILEDDPENLRRPGTREVVDPDEIFHEGFDEQLMAHISPQFRYGLFSGAIATAFKVLEDRVRDKAGYDNDVHGKDLMTKAFDEEDGPLTMGDLTAEQQGFKMMYMGSYAFLRNPRSHRILDDMDQKQARDAITMVNFLLTLIENQTQP